MAHAEPTETIEPFGGFSWGSGLYEVMRATSMEGEILLAWRNTSIPVPERFAESDLPDLLHKLAMKGKDSAFRLTDADLRRRSDDLRRHSVSGIMEFSSRSGPILAFAETHIFVVVKEGVVISGVPFSLSATL